MRSSRRLLADRITDQLQQVRFDVAGDTLVGGGDGAGDPAEPGQQHPGHTDHPPVMLLGGQMNQLLEGGVLEIAGRRGVLEQHPQLTQGDRTGG